MRRLQYEPCVFCHGGRSGKEGEHVLPRWLLDLWPAEFGPFTVYRNAEPERKRDGSVRTQPSATRFKLPVCERCNGVLDQRFEKPAKLLVRRLLTVSDPVLETSEAEVVGRWFVKTWLLLAHPEVRTSDPGWRLAPWDPLEPSLYEWMTSGLDVPTDLSAWLVRTDRCSPPATATRHMALPSVVADGMTIPFHILTFGLGSLDVSLVYHPKWVIDHPLVAEGRALRLWPPGSAVDVGGLPLVRRGEMAWLKGPTVHFRPHTFGRLELPPLSEFSDFMNLPGQAVQFVEL